MSNFIPPSDIGKLVELDYRGLGEHPLLATIPVWPVDSPEFKSLRESIRERGLDYPLLVDQQLRIVDGRNRRNAVSAIGGLPKPLTPQSRSVNVLCRVIDEREAASIAVSSLVNRRHLTKGALAYLVAPLFAGVLAESAARRVQNLRQNVKTALSAVSMKCVEDVAAQVGVGPRLFEQALRLRKMFDGLPSADRAKYEPRVLGEWQDDAGEWQDPVGLGYMINGLTSLAEEAGGREKELGKRSEHDRLFVAALPKLSLHWAKADESQRRAIAEALRAAVLQFPAELRDEIVAALKAAAKAHHA